MQYFDRKKIPPPDAFRSEAAVAERQEIVTYMQQTAARQAQTQAPSPRLNLSDESILLSLNELFRSKCAFCESKDSIHVHLFRPPADAKPLAQSEFAHLYYVWLRTDWQNFYLICTSCAKISARSFPVRNGDRGSLPRLNELEHFSNENYGLWRWPHTDQPLLLDPCEIRRFEPHFSVDLTGSIQPLSSRAEATISTFDLNRPDLVQLRARAYDRYLDLLQSELDRGISPTTSDFENLEFGGTWYLVLRRLAEKIGDRMGQSIDKTKGRLITGISKAYSTPLGREAFTAALEDIRQPEKPKRYSRQKYIPRPGNNLRLVSVHVENFKALQNLTLLIPPPIPASFGNEQNAESAALLVLGENATGKSSILEAIALALCGGRVRSHLEKSPNTFVLDTELMGAPDRPPPKQAVVLLRFEGGAELQLTMDNDFVETGVSQGLPHVFGYGAFRQYSTKAQKRRSTGNVGTLFHTDLILPNPEAWLLNLSEPQFAMVVRALRRILSIEGEFDVIQRDHSNQRCLIITTLDDGAHEIKTPLSVASSGFRAVLAMICDVFRGLLSEQRPGSLVSFDDAEAVILVDEVEAHLHPRWKMQIMTALRSVLPKATIIATTHDPLCLRGMHDREVAVLNRVRKIGADFDNGVPIYVETLAELPNVENLTIEQLLTSNLFAMFSTDSPVAERKLAQLGSLLARRAAGDHLSMDEEAALKELERQVVQALPLGSSEVQRLVQKAVAEYLQQRRDSSSADLAKLEDGTRKLIVAALEGY